MWRTENLSFGGSADHQEQFSFPFLFSKLLLSLKCWYAALNVLPLNCHANLWQEMAFGNYPQKRMQLERILEYLWMRALGRIILTYGSIFTTIAKATWIGG